MFGEVVLERATGSLSRRVEGKTAVSIVIEQAGTVEATEGQQRWQKQQG